jgi:hypothetical protein
MPEYSSSVAQQGIRLSFDRVRVDYDNLHKGLDAQWGATFARSVFARRRSILAMSVPALLLCCALIATRTALCADQVPDKTNSSAATTVIHGRAADYSVAVPTEWVQQSRQPGNSSFDSVVQSKDIFIGIIVGKAIDIRVILTSFMDEVQFDEPSRVIIDGRDWVSILARGSNKGTPIACLGFSYSDTNCTYRIIAWTRKDRLDQNKPAIDRAVGSFKFPPKS